MTIYTNVFGGDTIPPSEYAYRAVTLSADVTLGWPEVSTGTDLVAAIMDVTASGAYIITLPPADQVSTGRDILVKNVGSTTFTVSDNSGGVITTVAAGVGKYVYLTSNASVAGTWSVTTFATGTSAADASALAGMGLVVNGATLATDMAVSTKSAGYTVTSADRADVLRYTGGTTTWYLPAPATVNNGFFCAIANNGTGTLTIDATTAGGTIDGTTIKSMQPNETMFVFSNTTAWMSVGYGRSADFTFTQLATDVSTGGTATITITSAQATNKMWYFYNVAAGDRTVSIPAVASIYFVRVGAIGAGNDLLFTTGSGSTVSLSANQSYTIYCDGTNVVSAQTIAVTSSLALDDGSAAAPSLNFALDTNTGLYRTTTDSLGVSAGGVLVATFNSTGLVLVSPLTVANGGSGRATGTTAYALVATGTTATGAQQTLANGGTGEMLIGGGAAALPTWVSSTGTGSGVRATSPTIVTASLTSPTMTGTPVAPTAAVGTGTTQVATCAFVAATSFSTNLPAQTSNSGKYLTTDGASASWSAVLPSQTSNSGKFLQTNGTTTAWDYAGVASVTTATTATTLTSAPTLLKITPTSYGVAVTLPDATTCSVGGPIHIIDNRGAFPVKVLNSAGTLLGFVFAGVVSHISLDDNSTAAGVWAISNNELCAPSAQLSLSSNISAGTTIDWCIDLGNGKEILGGTTNSGYAIVYDKATNTFGASTRYRVTSGGCKSAAVYLAADKILVVSSLTTDFEAVVLSISGTTITANTAATATLSANMNAFADGCGLIAVGSSFVTSYTVATPAAQIRAITVSGTTPTIGAATVLAGTVGGLMVAGSATVAITASLNGTTLAVDPYTISGTTISIGTGTTRTGVGSLYKMITLPNGRWVTLADYWSVHSLSATTITSSAIAAGTATIALDAAVVGSNKVLVISDATSSNANILTDTAGTISVGSAITLSTGTARAVLYASGNYVMVQDGTTTYAIYRVDCSGSSPVKYTVSTGGSNVEAAAFSASNAVLSRSPKAVFGSYYARNVWMSAVTQNFDPEVTGDCSFRRAVHTNVAGDNTTPGAAYRGTAANQAWISNATTVLTKVECVP